MTNIPTYYFFKNGSNNENPVTKSLDELESRDLRDLEKLGYKWFKKGFSSSLESIKEAYSHVDYTFEDEKLIAFKIDTELWERDLYNESDINE